jgi:hypothetical protein
MWKILTSFVKNGSESMELSNVPCQNIFDEGHSIDWFFVFFDKFIAKLQVKPLKCEGKIISQC